MSKAEDQLKGKQVCLEVRLIGGGQVMGESRVDTFTSLYYGTFAGTDSIGSYDFVILENAEHFNCSGSFGATPNGLDDYIKAGPLSKYKIRSEIAYIKVDNIISIDVDIKEPIEKPIKKDR